jgi:chromosome segregation ATPase
MKKFASMNDEIAEANKRFEVYKETIEERQGQIVELEGEIDSIKNPEKMFGKEREKIKRQIESLLGLKKSFTVLV